MSKEVIIYGRNVPPCPYCENTKKFFDTNEVKYIYKDINDSDENFSEWQEYQVRTVPVITVDGENMGGFDQIKGILNQLQDKKVSGNIETVIKRDGSEVPFDESKLNKWGEWAANSSVPWSDIVFQAFRLLSDRCSTEDVQEALIKVCVDRGDPKHLDMAARLLVGRVYKNVFGTFENIPDLSTFYYSMVDSGKWTDMGYLEEELDALNEYIDHNKDFAYKYSTVKQITDKYVVQDRVSKQLFESPQFMYMGVAMANMQKMESERKIEDVGKLYTYLSDLKINAPTPTLAGLRTSSRGLASCCLFTTKDTADSIGVGSHIAYSMTNANSGIGGYVHTRSLGDGVRDGSIVHTGKLPYYRLYEASVKSTKQANRGGACTMYYSILDPEITTLLRLKHVTTPAEKQIRGMDYGCMINSFFVKKALKNEDWMLISAKDAPDLWEAFFTSKDNPLFVELYNKYLLSDVPKEMVSARKLALTMEQQWFESGRVYKLWVDEVNKHSPFKSPIYSSNLCVAPETQVLTDQGYIPIAEMENEEVNVWNGEEFTKTTIRKTGENKRLLKVKTTSGYEVECTPEHKWHVFTGYGKPCIVKETNQLLEGDKLIKFDLPVIEGTKTLAYAYDNGFYTADGSHSKGSSIVYLYHEKQELLEHFSDIYTSIREYPNDKRTVLRSKKGSLKDKFFVPSSGYTIASRLEWLAGFLDGDGCVHRNGTNEALTACSIEYNFLREVQFMLQTLGVSSKITDMMEEGMRSLPANDGTGELKEYYCSKSWRLLISSCDSYKLLDLGLKLNRLKIMKRLPQRDAKQFVKIKSITDEGRIDDTFCFTESKRNMGMFNGMLTGNCNEIMLPTRGFLSTTQLHDKEVTLDKDTPEIALCFLAALVAGRITVEEYEDVAYYAALMIDNTMDIMTYPFPQMEVTAKARRSIGVGITNLADHMAVNGRSYTTASGKKFIHDHAEMHSFYLHKASLRLAKEKGVAEWINDTKYPEGWLPVDTYNKNVDSLVTGLNYDWEGLRKEIVEVGGLRNSVLEATPPTESSSQASNTTNSIYPARQLKIIKGKVPCFVPHYEDEVIRDNYESAWDLPFKDMVDMYALVQKFHGQGISADFWFNPDKHKDRKVGTKEQLQNLAYATKMGLKGAYYMNTRSSEGAVAEKENVCSSDGCDV